MKTSTEIKFDKVIKLGFHETLKPLGFKKKGNNFYLARQELGQIINIQKSSFYSKDHIHFTINTGFFIPEYWLEYYNFHNGKTPAYPTEPECLVRKRIGELKNQKDTWYDLTEDTDEDDFIREMQDDLRNHILPYFEKVITKQDLLAFLNTENLILAPLGKLIVYGELKQFEKAKIEFNKLKSERSRGAAFLNSVEEYGKKYNLT